MRSFPLDACDSDYHLRHSYRDAWQYLPSHTVSKSEDEPESSSLPPPIPCYFGPFGGQSRVELEALSSYPLSEYMEDSRAHVFNAGAAVWGLDWCPIEESNALRQSKLDDTAGSKAMVNSNSLTAYFPGRC